MEKSAELDTNEQILLRKEKLDKLKELGQAFPNDFKRKHLAQDIHNRYAELSKEDLASAGEQVQIAGRIMMRRLMGKASFIHIQDMSGKMQLYLRKNDLAAGVYEQFKTWDIGDIVGATGMVFKTNTGELSIKVETIQLLTKSLRPLPDKWHGLADQEIRYRQRYLDLIVNKDVRKTFEIRTAILAVMRNFFNTRGFLEVETPMMQVVPGGATARPFITHHNALDMDLYLRVAPELYLKRLVVGGFEKVYEINKNFRNEGLSTRHNPEFTMIEFYQAYADYKDLMDLTETLIREIAQQVIGNLSIEYQGHICDLAKPFARLSVKAAVLQYNPSLSVEVLNNKEQLSSFFKSNNYEVDDSWGLGKLQYELFEKTVEAKLYQPTFITEYPTEVSPLARRNDADPSVTDRFELFVGGRELANAFSELNDPIDQAERFRQQVASKDAGDQEAMHYDYDYIRALEYGLPPTAGEGIGIDRLVMFFTNSPSIRDVILFPHMRRELGTNCQQKS